MDHLFDEFSKSLSQSVPRRESLRRLAAVMAGAVLSPMGLETAFAGKVDPCKAFCKCRNAKQQNQCLDACKKCSGNTSRLGGACGSYTCCAIASCTGVCSNLKSDPNCGACGNNCKAFGTTCCGSFCADLTTDVFNCGRCGTVCPPPDENEYVACVSGRCVYDCVDGADDCNGTCTFLDSDPDNCGTCGNVCPDSLPHCHQGECSLCPAGQELCGNSCVDVLSDPLNCGTCGNACPDSDTYCVQGGCTYCGGYGAALCDGNCVFILSDNGNCGACGVQCAADEICTGGVCLGTNSGIWWGWGY
jgi:hypothetical protein